MSQIMPTPRKRIGFLPRAQVQEIIDKICEEENLNQLKVVGILVEEALAARGIFIHGLLRTLKLIQIGSLKQSH